jgi:hypothetical protein
MNVGDGHDTIYYENPYRVAGDGIGILRFGPGIAPEDVSVNNSGNNVVFLATLGDGSSISATFVNAKYGVRYQIDEIQFSNGVVWKWATMPKQ